MGKLMDGSWDRPSRPYKDRPQNGGGLLLREQSRVFTSIIGAEEEQMARSVAYEEGEVFPSVSSCFGFSSFRFRKAASFLE